MATPLHIVLMGAPGAGKSTQARLLKARYPLQVLSTGQLLREEAARQTALGLLAEAYLARGALLPDEVMVALITERLLRLPPEQGFLLDGFPRTLPQAEALQQLSEKLQRPLTAVIALALSEQEAVRRLGGRRMCEGLGDPFPVHIEDRASVDACLRLGGRLVQRPDDQPEVILERLRTYEAETRPLLEFYEQRGLLFRISAEGSPEQVHQAIVAVLEARLRPQA
ncbi:adenylate kinase family protein [Kallotenue papyrolyticum]|uniref:adenylate kinase family protein n=1 Tax=Kallotenue papyrolyticum TaxID=1325125 RepID=UPI0004BBD2DD|nr:nucleoside monophosphate kinase [Kallotenue papyrolyticum]